MFTSVPSHSRVAANAARNRAASSATSVLRNAPIGCTNDRAAATPFTSAAVRQKLTIHESRLKTLFRKWATEDETRQTINMTEWMDMFAASGVIGPDLTEAKLREAFVIAELGDHPGALASWEEAGEDACCELIFPEFVEAILRAAMLKFDNDPKTPIDLKIHELCLLLIFGPAGLQPPPASNDLQPLSGVERRAMAAAAVLLNGAP